MIYRLRLVGLNTNPRCDERCQFSILKPLPLLALAEGLHESSLLVLKFDKRQCEIFESLNILESPSNSDGKQKTEQPMQDDLRRFKAEIFQALAHPTRIAIVELLRDAGEVPVTSIYERLELIQANASQHLAVLRAKHIVVTRKEGNQVFYSLRDQVLGKVLDLMRDYFHAHLEESLGLLKDMRTNERRRKKSASGEAKS